MISLNGEKLKQDQGHLLAYEKWHLFRKHVLKALKNTYGEKSVKSGRKSLKVAKGKIPAAADVVVTLHCENGIALYLPDEYRWVCSYPQQHFSKGKEKEKRTNHRYKRTIRMFKTARNLLVDNKIIKDGTATSYFIECLLYNVPDDYYTQNPGQSYVGIVEFLEKTKIKPFKCQNEMRNLFDNSKDIWNENDAHEFIQALRILWRKWSSLK